jgi:hypothetical protein
LLRVLAVELDALHRPNRHTRDSPDAFLVERVKLLRADFIAHAGHVVAKADLTTTRVLHHLTTVIDLVPAGSIARHAA